MVEIKKSHNFYKPNNPLDFQEIEETKGYLKDILEVEPCPNCGKDMIAWKCSDSKMCWYWHWEDYFLEKIEKKRQLSESLKWNWEKHQLIALNWKKFFYFDFHWRIQNTTALMEFEIDWKKYKVEIKYEILNKDDIKNISSISIIWEIKTQWKNKRWKKTYFEYKELKKYIFAVLSDYRFNKFLSEQ